MLAMHFKIFFLISSIGLLFLSFNALSQTQTSEINNFVLNVPPNVIYIRDNFYCGQTEISNINYREYVYWMGKIYGKNSLNYLSSLPDTHIWNGFPHCFLILSEQYFVYPKYDDYPVVGISQLQAKEYCKWLSDRYFESMLIKEGIINMNPNQSEDSFFSIESYFSGTYNIIIPSKDIRHYPYFRLPNLQERTEILAFSKQSSKMKSKQRNPLHFNKQIWTSDDIQSDINPCNKEGVPTRMVSKKVKKRSKNSIFNLRGNVGEWLSEKNVSAGGGWVDKREIILKEDTTTVMYPNAWTGFRVVFEWRKWNN
jgi:hypothetical protein